MQPAFIAQPNRDKAVEAECRTCHKTIIWLQVGTVPKFCDTCFSAHREDRTYNRDFRPIWMKGEITAEGTFLERIDELVHYSPQSKRWYVKEPERWVGATEV